MAREKQGIAGSRLLTFDPQGDHLEVFGLVWGQSVVVQEVVVRWKCRLQKGYRAPGPGRRQTVRGR